MFGKPFYIGISVIILLNITAVMNMIEPLFYDNSQLDGCIYL